MNQLQILKITQKATLKVSTLYLMLQVKMLKRHAARYIAIKSLLRTCNMFSYIIYSSTIILLNQNVKTQLCMLRLVRIFFKALSWFFILVMNVSLKRGVGTRLVSTFHIIIIVSIYLTSAGLRQKNNIIELSYSAIIIQKAHHQRWKLIRILHHPYHRSLFLENQLTHSLVFSLSTFM